MQNVLSAAESSGNQCSLILKMITDFFFITIHTLIIIQSLIKQNYL